MYPLQIAAITLFLCLSATACSTNPAQHSSLTSPKDQHQEATISRWHRCLNKQIAYLDHQEISPFKAIDLTLEHCQGHKRDVLATFPIRYESHLSQVMIDDAYDKGLEQIARQRDMPAAVSASYRRMLINRKTQL